MVQKLLVYIPEVRGDGLVDLPCISSREDTAVDQSVHLKKGTTYGIVSCWEPEIYRVAPECDSSVLNAHQPEKCTCLAGKKVNESVPERVCLKLERIEEDDL